MPTSWYHVIPRIIGRVLVEHPDSLLDVGVGFGKYGLLLRETLEVADERYEKSSWKVRIDGVEAFDGYRNPIHEYIYDHIEYKPIEEALPALGRYDVILLIDVLEHFKKEVGHDILKKLLAHTNKALIISTPVIPAKQEEYLGNLYEAHQSRWHITDFTNFEEDFSLVDIGYEKALIVKLYPNDGILNKNKLLYVRDNALLNQAPEAVSGIISEPRRLKIAYILPHRSITGGMKILLDQISWLKSHGHEVYSCLRSKTKADSSLPDWNRPAVDKDIVIRPQEAYAPHIKDADVIVAGWVEQLPELCGIGIPVVYTEQGSESFFGDLSSVGGLPDYHGLINSLYASPCYFSSVSGFVADILEKRFGRKSALIPNGVDTNLFHPGTPPNNNVILLVGNPKLAFKGFDTALQTFERLWHFGHRFKVNWICQTKPDIHGNSYPVHIYVNPEQKRLPELYREADIFVCTSWYEGFGLPPLEAMACGVPVICTRCGGPDIYLSPNKNALVIPPGDEKALAAAIQYLLTNKNNVRQVLSENGRKTALKFSLDKSLAAFEAFLKCICSKKKITRLVFFRRQNDLHDIQAFRIDFPSQLYGAHEFGVRRFQETPFII